MPDTTPYPRKTVSTVQALLSGAISSVAITALVLGVGGSSITKHVRTTSAINVSSMAAGQATSSAVALTGASVGDQCNVSVTAGDYLSTTSTGLVNCRITAADVATLYFRNATGTASFDAGASTFSIQSWTY